jgi:hypothetical protein
MLRVICIRFRRIPIQLPAHEPPDVSIIKFAGRKALSTPGMPICVYLKGQNRDREAAVHSASRRLAAWLILDGASVISQYALQLTTNESWRAVKDRFRAPRPARSSYIPEKMPPRDVPNVRFIPPQSHQWRLAHRLVTFLPTV